MNIYHISKKRNISTKLHYHIFRLFLWWFSENIGGGGDTCTAGGILAGIGILEADSGRTVALKYSKG